MTDGSGDCSMGLKASRVWHRLFRVRRKALREGVEAQREAAAPGQVQNGAPSPSLEGADAGPSLEPFVFQHLLARVLGSFKTVPTTFWNVYNVFFLPSQNVGE